VHGINKVFHGSLVKPTAMADYEAKLAKARDEVPKEEPSASEEASATPAAKRP
jgi:hypothetical protein